MKIDEMAGSEFREARRRLGLTQSELGKILGCTRQHIWSMEDRVCVPGSYALAVRQLEAMNVNEAA